MGKEKNTFKERLFFQYEQRAGRIYLSSYEFGDLKIEIDGQKRLMLSPVRPYPASGIDARFGRLHTTLTTWHKERMYIFDLALLIGLERNDNGKVGEQVIHRITGTEIKQLYHRQGNRPYVVEFGKYD